MKSSNIASIEGNSLSLAIGKAVTFAFPIGNAIEYDGVIIVRLDIPRGASFNENIFGLSDEGDILWQIGQEFPPDRKTAWAGMDLVDGKLIVSNSESKVYTVDPKLGTVLQRGMSYR